MNNRENHTRLTCRVARFWLSVFPGFAAAPARRHATTCDECKAFLSASKTMEDTLRMQASAIRSEPLAGMEARIGRAVRNIEKRNQQEPRLGWFRLAIGIPAMAAAIAIALFLIHPNHQRSPLNTGPMTIAGTGQQSSVVATDGEPSSADIWASIGASAQTLATQNPLQQEAQSVYGDARSAIHFLALNFLPIPAEQTNRLKDGNSSS